MVAYGCCPVCKNEITPERLEQSPIVCQACGWTESKKQNINHKADQKRFISGALAISAFLVFSFIHTVNWDNYSFEIVPLKAKTSLGVAGPYEYHRLAQICTERAKPSCVEDAYADLLQTEPQNLDNYHRYGKVLAFNGKTSAAEKIYKRYFDLGGIEVDAAYTYAKILGEQGKVDEASQYYSNILKAKPETLQVTVTQSYVDLLMTHNRFKEAKKVIEKLRKKNTSAEYFMEAQLKRINDILKTRKPSAI